MPMLHDPAFRDDAKRRLNALRPDAQRQWGAMSVDQMLWHVNRALEAALGRYRVARRTPPLPPALMKFVVLTLPWPKGRTPTSPEFVARGSHDFEAERRHLLSLLDDLAAKPLEAPWGESAFLGPMSGRDWSRLQAKHVDHHLRQFGV